MNRRSTLGIDAKMRAWPLELLAAAFALLHITPINAQNASGAVESVTVGSMAEATDALVSRYSYVITLETPRYLYEGDLEDQPAQFRNDADRVAKGTAPKILIAKGTQLTLSLPARASIGPGE